jgi:hypothetical protein
VGRRSSTGAARLLWEDVEAVELLRWGGRLDGADDASAVVEAALDGTEIGSEACLDGGGVTRERAM